MRIYHHLGFRFGRTPDVFLRYELLGDHGVELFVSLTHGFLQLHLPPTSGGETRGTFMYYDRPGRLIPLVYVSTRVLLYTVCFL